MENKYEEKNKQFDILMKLYNFSDREEHENDRLLCEKLSKIKKYKINKIDFDYDNLKNMFFKSINDLGDDTKEYYKKHIPLIKTKKAIVLNNGYAEIISIDRKQSIYVTKKPFKNIDFIAFSHELGHVPTLRNSAKGDFFEYSEVLSIFFEYLSCISLYGDNAKEFFIQNRLNNSKDEALDYLKFYNDTNCLNNHHYLYFQNMKKDRIKYICSLEYALYLIDLYNEDKVKIPKVIDNVICGYSSFKETEKELDININSYKKLTKEIKY